jgi:type II secretory pathway pseudopilin PulG
MAAPSTPGERHRLAARGTGAPRGATYLALLLAIAFVAGSLAASATVWSQVQRRERETQLLWAGDQFRRALMAYAAAGDTGYPQRLEDLLEDPRSPAPRRFLRRLYDDPMAPGTGWVLIRNQRGGIVGVHSRSTAVPLKTGRFASEYADFAFARSYADWIFTAVAPAPRGAPALPPAAPASAARDFAPRPLQPQAAHAPASAAQPGAPDAQPASIAQPAPAAQPAEPPPAEPEPPPDDTE